MEGLPKTVQQSLSPTPKPQSSKQPPEHTTPSHTVIPISPLRETDNKPLLSEDSKTSTAPPTPEIPAVLPQTVPVCRDREFPRQSRFSNPNIDLERMYQARAKSKCLCWSISCPIILFVAVFAIFGVYIKNIQPPQFSVNTVNIIGLDLKTDGTISPKINATLVSHESKMLHVGVKGSTVVYYNSDPHPQKLCRGVTPKFMKSTNDVMMVDLEFKCSNILLPMTDRKVMMRELRDKKLGIWFHVKAPARAWKLTLRIECRVEVESLVGQVELHSQQCWSKLGY